MTLQLGNQFPEEDNNSAFIGGTDYCGVLQDTLSGDVTLNGVALKARYGETATFGAVLYDGSTNELLASGEVSSFTVSNDTEARIDFDVPYSGVSGQTFLFGIYKLDGGPFGLRSLLTSDQRLENSENAAQPLDPWSEDFASNNEDTFYLYVYSAAGPSITSVTDSVGSTADRVTDGQNATIQFSEAVTVTGVELQNSAGIYVATLPIQSSTTDSVTVQGARGQLRYGDADNKIVATLDDASTVEYTGITLAAPSGTFWVNGSSPDTTSENSVFLDTVSAPSGDYQLAWRDPNNVAGTTTTEKQNLIDSTGKVADIAQPGEVPVDGYDETDGSWTGEVIYTAELDDVSGIRRTLRDRLGNVQANLADLRVQVQKAFPSGVAPVFTATNEATDGSGVLLLDEPSMNLNSVTGESLGTTDGSGALPGTLASAGNSLFSKAEEFSFSATIGAETIVDDGQGSLHLDGDSGASRGTITYSTGAFSITGAPVSTSASADYNWRQSELHVTLTSANGEDVGGGWFTVIDTTTADESLMRGETP